LVGPFDFVQLRNKHSAKYISEFGVFSMFYELEVTCFDQELHQSVVQEEVLPELSFTRFPEPQCKVAVDLSGVIAYQLGGKKAETLS
jgi:hypothetical protein